MTSFDFVVFVCPFSEKDILCCFLVVCLYMLVVRVVL